jgi:hypothetical protein
MFSLPLYFYFEAGAFLTSAIVLHKFNNKPLRWFIPFLLLVVSTELVGLYYQKVLHKPNTWLYNITIPAEYIFYGIMIGRLCVLKSYKKLAYLLTAVYFCWAITNILFIQGYTNLATYNLKAGSIFMVVASATGLLDLFRNDENKTLLKNPLFWICTGILFFNSGEFIYYFFLDILLKNNWDQFAKVFRLINNNLIYVLYTCLSIAIVCSKISEKKV